jgi:hypothetical protein
MNAVEPCAFRLELSPSFLIVIYDELSWLAVSQDIQARK